MSAKKNEQHTLDVHVLYKIFLLNENQETQRARVWEREKQQRKRKPESETKDEIGKRKPFNCALNLNKR